jgi:predicted enzyme related to lactoylglutathione lyase
VDSDWQAGRMDSGRPCWIDITVTNAEDREQLVAFLCDVFGWTFEVTSPDTGYYTMLRQDGADVAAVGQQPTGGARWVTFLATSDIDASTTHVRDAGGSVFVEPMAIMRAGSMALAVDPAGAVFGLWQPDLFAGFPDVIAAGCPEWFHHGSQDPDTVARFYAEAFDLQVIPADGDTMLGREGRGYFSLGRNIAGNPPDLRPVILVDDLAEIEARVTRAGGEIFASRIEVPGGFATTFADPVVGAPLIVSANEA